MSTVRFVLLILAVLSFALAALEIKAPKVDLTALGLALLAVAMALEARE